MGQPADASAVLWPRTGGASDHEHTSGATAAATNPNTAGEQNLSCFDTLQMSRNHPLEQAVSPLSLNVPLKIKEKIWAHNFIDLEQLLNKQESKQSLKLEMDKEKGPLLCSASDKPISSMSIEKWTSAFLIFAFIYLKKYNRLFPNKSLELLQYMETIRFAASHYGIHS